MRNRNKQTRCYVPVDCCSFQVLHKFRLLYLYFTTNISMTTVAELIKQIADARKSFIDVASMFSESSSKWKVTAETWCATEITEHLFWAEQGGVLGMWKSLCAHREGKSNWQGDTPHKGLPIEEIVNKTWKEKETVPVVAAPRLGGPIVFWIVSLHDLQNNLDEFAKELTDRDLEIMTQPHPISGPLNVHQRLEFLRFHLKRHQRQLEEIRSQPVFRD